MAGELIAREDAFDCRGQRSSRTSHSKPTLGRRIALQLVRSKRRFTFIPLQAHRPHSLFSNETGKAAAGPLADSRDTTSVN